MSLFGGFFSGLDDDPFFGGHMQQMNRMMNTFDMFGGFGGGFGAARPRTTGAGALMPFGFPAVDSIMDNFKIGGMGMAMNNGNMHSFSQSTVMTMSSGPDGQPQIYQASQSMRTAPGGVKETKKAVCDSRTGTKRMAIGRHIGERGHVRERVHNLHSGEQEENEDYINLDEDEAERFNDEWQTKARDFGRRRHVNAAMGYRDRGDAASDRRHRDLPAILPGSVTITEITDDDDVDVVAEKSTRKRQRQERVEDDDVDVVTEKSSRKRQRDKFPNSTSFSAPKMDSFKYDTR